METYKKIDCYIDIDISIYCQIEFNKYSKKEYIAT